MFKRFFVIAALALLVTALPALAQDASTPEELCAAATPAEDAETLEFDAAEDVLDPDVDYRAVLCTGAGAVYVDLLEEQTPITVNNFVFLAESGYYNNTTFHRVIEGFMAQAGDPTGTGAGGPGYRFEDEFVGFLHFDEPGWLAMANAGPGTNGSQFFITTVPTPHLDYRHTIFGEVLEGQDIVESIELRDPQTATEPGESLDTVLIITDPASVETTYEAPETASAEDIEAGLQQLTAGMPAELLVNEEVAGIFETDEVVSLVPGDFQEDYAALLDELGHEFRVGFGVDNPECSDQYFFVSMRYTLDSFASADDAAAALESDLLRELPLEMGFEERTDSDLIEYPLFSTELEACDADASRILTRWQRGSNVVTAEATYIPSAEIEPELFLSEAVALLFERSIAGALRAEIR